MMFPFFRDMDCSTDPSLPTYSSYFGSGKTAIDSTIQGHNTGVEDTTAWLRLQLDEQYPYPSYGGLDLPDAKKLKPDSEMNFQGNPFDYEINSNFQLLRRMCDDDVHHAWIPPSEPFTTSMLNGNPFSQVNFFFLHFSFSNRFARFYIGELVYALSLHPMN